MTDSYFITLFAGISAAIGAGGVLMGAVSQDDQRRLRLHRIGTCGLTLCGAVLMLGAIVGWQGTDAMVWGLLLIVFGTGTQLAPLAKAQPAARATPAP